ncbi:MAG: Unknown protein [uncultured Sulfurovum sp.]|uniref:Uncharacterized protein n=1 Tax=uncultured Sulfurovum sp. TaxID=269237 RepID=A0A6S6T452_9BACT|nr:MAG: Unknown protein [uncultured Sulfurovum sp.]
MKNKGFKNEQELIEALNQRYFAQLNPNLQRLIHQTFQNHEGLIHCQSQAGVNKSDIKISIANESHTYSVKMGKGNSIHQEPLEDFLTFLTQEHQLDVQTKSYLQAFIWADGSVDGTGAITERISARKFKKRNPEKIKHIQNYFNGIKNVLIQRFLIKGVASNASAEYLYYGTARKGIVCKSTDIVKWVSQHKSRGVLSIGKLTLQAWNRNLKGKKRAEKKRGIVQIKWGGLKKDLRKIAKVNLGKQQEIDFVKTLNQKEKLRYWKTLGLEPSSHYAIRVISQKYGKVNQRKVWAKADAFIAKGIVPLNYLKLNDFFLDENDIKKFNLSPIAQTGISIKQNDSTQYQILKIAPSTFEKLFSSNMLGAGASMYYKKKKKLPLNSNILKAWNINEEDFFAYYTQKLQLPINSVVHSNCQKCLKQIKRYANKEIAKRIKENPTLSNFIFLGIGNFQEPFTAPWLFEQSLLQKNYRIPFSVTTGSGRSKGKCTIVIKPK